MAGYDEAVLRPITGRHEIFPDQRAVEWCLVLSYSYVLAYLCEMFYIFVFFSDITNVVF
jgi:hypothetical protein